MDVPAEVVSAVVKFVDGDSQAANFMVRASGFRYDGLGELVIAVMLNDQTRIRRLLLNSSLVRDFVTERLQVSRDSLASLIGMCQGMSLDPVAIARPLLSDLSADDKESVEAVLELMSVKSQDIASLRKAVISVSTSELERVFLIGMCTLFNQFQYNRAESIVMQLYSLCMAENKEDVGQDKTIFAEVQEEAMQTLDVILSSVMNIDADFRDDMRRLLEDVTLGKRADGSFIHQAALQDEKGSKYKVHKEITRALQDTLTILVLMEQLVVAGVNYDQHEEDQEKTGDEMMGAHFNDEPTSKKPETILEEAAARFSQAACVFFERYLARLVPEYTAAILGCLTRPSEFFVSVMEFKRVPSKWIERFESEYITDALLLSRQMLGKRKAAGRMGVHPKMFDLVLDTAHASQLKGQERIQHSKTFVYRVANEIADYLIELDKPEFETREAHANWRMANGTEPEGGNLVDSVGAMSPWKIIIGCLFSIAAKPTKYTMLNKLLFVQRLLLDENERSAEDYLERAQAAEFVLQCIAAGNSSLLQDFNKDGNMNLEALDKLLHVFGYKGQIRVMDMPPYIQNTIRAIFTQAGMDNLGDHLMVIASSLNIDYHVTEAAAAIAKRNESALNTALVPVCSSLLKEEPGVINGFVRGCIRGDLSEVGDLAKACHLEPFVVEAVMTAALSSIEEIQESNVFKQAEIRLGLKPGVILGLTPLVRGHVHMSQESLRKCTSISEAQIELVSFFLAACVPSHMNDDEDVDQLMRVHVPRFLIHTGFLKELTPSQVLLYLSVSKGDPAVLQELSSGYEQTSLHLPTLRAFIKMSHEGCMEKSSLRVFNSGSRTQPNDRDMAFAAVLGVPPRLVSFIAAVSTACTSVRFLTYYRLRVHFHLNQPHRLLMETRMQLISCSG